MATSAADHRTCHGPAPWPHRRGDAERFPAAPGQPPVGLGSGIPGTRFPPGFQPPNGIGAFSRVQREPPPGQSGFQTTPSFQTTPGSPLRRRRAANLINQILTTPRPGGLNVGRSQLAYAGGGGLRQGATVPR